jgi:hypothetical protein
MKDKFITEALLQNARTLTKQAIFGNPSINVQYATALKTEMEKQVEARNAKKSGGKK